MLRGVDAVVAQEARVRHEGVLLGLHRGDERQDGALLRRVREVDAAEDEQRVGADGFAEYLTTRLERSVVMTVVVPEGFPEGASLRVATGHQKYFYVQIPEGVGPGDPLSVQVLPLPLSLIHI